jgi:hypothetical protein
MEGGSGGKGYLSSFLTFVLVLLRLTHPFSTRLAFLTGSNLSYHVLQCKELDLQMCRVNTVT